LTCREFTEFLDRYVAGELLDEERLEFERHLKVCEPCVRYLSTYRQAVEMGKRAFQSPGEVLPDEVPERLVQAILAARKATG